MIKSAKIFAISISNKKGEKKKNVGKAIVRENFGIIGDAHAGLTSRQLSILSLEAIKKMQKLGVNCKPGDFAENITTEGFDVSLIKIGTKLQLGKDIIIEITQIGKECHTKCEIGKQVGDCIMPKEGIFAKVLSGGEIKIKDKVKIV